jgi:acyl-coenzyme A synthetase/AMP-(fatty) acid ligase
MASQARSVIGIVAVNSPHYVTQVLAEMERGNLVVPLRNAQDQERIEATSVQKVLTPEPGFGWFQPHYVPRDSDEVAQVSFTSGTEGNPKGVRLSHRAFSDVTRRLNDVMEVDESIAEYIGVPVYHSFGFGRCRAVAAAGGKAYLPEDGFNPLEISEMLSDARINAISAVPSLWRTVLEAKDLFSDCGVRLRWIEIGSQYMSREEKTALRELFPRARIVQHYGLTEASRSTFLKIDTERGEHLESVGKPLGQVEVKISDDERIMIRGPHVARSILRDGQETSPLDAAGWYSTNDRGKLRDGYLYFLGRADDVINCGGLKLSPERLETELTARTGIASGFAICRVPDRIRGDGILLAVESERADRKNDLVEALLAEAEKAGIHAAGAVRICEIERLPRTPTGKVQRRLLSERHAEAPLVRPSAHHSAPSADDDGRPSNDRERQLMEIWKQALGTSDVRVDDSFYDVGGDSVTALSVIVRMSRAGIDQAICRRILQGATIRELAAEPGEGGAQVTLAARESGGSREYVNTLLVNVLRGLLVMTVIVGHWSGGATKRFPAGFSWLSDMLAPYFSLGTPGFAVVFGAGFGYLYVHRIHKAPKRVWAAMRIGMMIVGSGILLLAALTYTTLSKLPAAAFYEIFYSVLLFYFLALPTMPLWSRLAAAFEGRRSIAMLGGSALIMAALSWRLHLALDDVRADGFLRLVRLMLVAKYSYPSMIAGVLAGMAAGVYVRKNVEQDHLPQRLALVGGGFMLSALFWAKSVGELGFLLFWPSPLTFWKWMLYYGVVLTLWAALLTFRHDYWKRSQPIRKVLEAIATVGQLSLPFYVFHETIMPLKAAIEAIGATDAIATLMSLLFFFLVSAFMIKRVRSLSHSS